MKTDKQKALELAYLMLYRIADGGSFSTLQYHANMALIASEIPVDRLNEIKRLATKKDGAL